MAHYELSRGEIFASSMTVTIFNCTLKKSSLEIRGGAANFLLGGPSSNLKEAFFVWNSYIYHRGVASFFSEGEGQNIISQFIFG